MRPFCQIARLVKLHAQLYRLCNTYIISSPAISRQRTWIYHETLLISIYSLYIIPISSFPNAWIIEVRYSPSLGMADIQPGSDKVQPGAGSLQPGAGSLQPGTVQVQFRYRTSRVRYMWGTSKYRSGAVKSDQRKPNSYPANVLKFKLNLYLSKVNRTKSWPKSIHFW